MALCLTKYNHQLRFFSNFSSSSFFLFFSIIVVPTIIVSMGVFVFILVLFHSLERLIYLCSFLFYLKNVQECLVIYDPSLSGHGAKTWGNMDNQCWNMHTSNCSIMDLWDQKL
jgi:cellulose synthase/poly-beta-1,6-N-acetylglucosamine synthase-like glycosyltransferase